jgi:hypothetical protein
MENGAPDRGRRRFQISTCQPQQIEVAYDAFAGIAARCVLFARATI